MPESGLLFWMTIVFIIVFLVLLKWGFPSIIKMVNDRKAFIDDSLRKAHEANEPRLTIALVREPFTDEKRTKWLTAITKQEMASASGQTGSVNQYKMEAATIMTTWISSAVSGSKMIAYNGTQVFNNQYGMAQLRKTIRTNVLDP